MRDFTILFVLAGVAIALVLWTNASHEIRPTSASSVTQIADNATHSTAAAKGSRAAPPTQSVEYANRWDELTRQMEAGDVAATSALFRDSTRCHQIASEINTLNAELRVTPPRGWHQKDRDALIERQAQERDKLNALAQDLAKLSCEEDSAAFDQMRFESTAKMAEAGDPDAQLCFIESDFHMKGVLQRPLTDEEIDNYKQRAQAYVEAAVERGDWRVVPLLATPVSRLQHAGLLGLVVRGDPLTEMRMLNLLLLGAQGAYADEIRKRVQLMNTANPDAVSRAVDWAQRQYDRYFAQKARNAVEPKACGV